MQEREQFIQLIHKTYQEADQKLIERALAAAEKAHVKQKRVSGEPYILHPIKTAGTLATMSLDPQTIAAALLHDTVDDTELYLEEIEKQFGDEIAFLVSGVSKLGQVRFPKDKVEIRPIQERKEEPIDPRMENLRRMFIAMAQDLRVIFIKLADRLHNMQTLQFLPQDKQKRIALETVEVFAPLAYRLGMWEMRSQLEDLAFPYLYPKEYYWLLLNVKERHEERKHYLDQIQPMIPKILKEYSVTPVNVDSRAKHYWSLYNKLLRYNMNFDLIHDLIAMRVIVPTIADCYETLGALHLNWKPLPGRIKDYIALPKPNGYQSLHTTVLCEKGKITEFQIRTPKMHKEAEFGVAAHWAYKENVFNAGAKNDRSLGWIKQMSQWQTHIRGSKEFFESLKIDFFKNRIFVFTPKGDIVDLPEDATPVDFAYQLHSAIGDHCTGAKINSKLVSLDSRLRTGDQIEIITSKHKHPNRDWLDFVKTNTAKVHIKKWLKSASFDQNLARGLRLVNQELGALQGTSWEGIPKDKKERLCEALSMKTPEQILASLGNGDLSIKEILKYVLEERKSLKTAPSRMIPKLAEESQSIAIGGTYGLMFNIAKCCGPIFPRAISAFLTKAKGAAIHSADCPNIVKAQKNEKTTTRIVAASWHKAPQNYLATIKIIVEDRIGLLRDIASYTSTLGVNIISSTAKAPIAALSDNSDPAHVILDVELPSFEKLAELIGGIKEIDGVLEIKRV